MKTKNKHRADKTKGQYVLRLFVAGATARSQQAILQLRELTRTRVAGRNRIEVIDIYQQPGLARRHQIVATPTLIVVQPKPVRRFIGNLTSLPELFLQLDAGAAGRLAS